MDNTLFIEKIQLAEIDPDKKYLIMIKLDDAEYPEPSYFERAGTTIINAMVRLGCKSENISVTFGYAMQIVSITTDEA